MWESAVQSVSPAFFAADPVVPCVSVQENGFRARFSLLFLCSLLRPAPPRLAEIDVLFFILYRTILHDKKKTAQSGRFSMKTIAF